MNKDNKFIIATFCSLCFFILGLLAPAFGILFTDALAIAWGVCSIALFIALFVGLSLAKAIQNWLKSPSPW